MTEPTKNYVKASVSDRATAFIIDHILITFIWGMSTFLIAGSDIYKEDFDQTILRNSMFATIPLFFALYFCKDFMNGISPGRWLTGIMVRTDDACELPSRRRLFIRNLYLTIWPIEYVVLSASDEGKRWGDEKVNTVVVDNPSKAKRVYRVSAIAIAALAIFFIYRYNSKALIESSNAYAIVSKHVETSDLLHLKYGDIIDIESTRNSKIGISRGYGEAIIEIQIQGSESTSVQTFNLVKNPDEPWQLVEEKGANIQ
ncbi:MAG: RDD family protein [Reichenbachiella sp.]